MPWWQRKGRSQRSKAVAFSSWSSSLRRGRCAAGFERPVHHRKAVCLAPAARSLLRTGKGKFLARVLLPETREIGDHVGALFLLAQSCKGHLGAFYVIAWLFQKRVERLGCPCLTGGGALLEPRGILEPLDRPDRAPNHPVQHRPDAVLRVLADHVAGLTLAEYLFPRRRVAILRHGQLRDAHQTGQGKNSLEHGSVPPAVGSHQPFGMPCDMIPGERIDEEIGMIIARLQPDF